MRINTKIKASGIQMNHNQALTLDKKRSDRPIARCEDRVKLPIFLYIKRPNNSSSYRREVKTINISSNGACIICDVELEEGAMLKVYAFNNRFAAVAIVRHCERRQEGDWLIGLKFIHKTGSWAIS